MRRYILTMKVLAVVYAITGACFFFVPAQVIGLLNLSQSILHLGEPMPLAPERFWLVMTVAMMAMLTALSVLAAREPKVRGYAYVHILSKLTSTFGFLFMYFFDHPYYAYLAGIGSDLPLAILVFLMLRGADST